MRTRVIPFSETTIIELVYDDNDNLVSSKTSLVDAELGAGVLALDDIELQEEHSTDAMICFKIPDVIRDELKEKYPFIQDADSLHITLVYLGDTRTLDAGSVIEAITNWSAYQAPIKGKLQGLARFVNGEEVDPLVMTFDSKQMPKVHEVLCDFLYGEKIEFHKEHGFIPHMTLAYIPKDEDMPVQTIEPIEINFTSVWLVWNGEWVEVELSGVLNRLSWSADDFGLTELHLPGKHDQSSHGNDESQEDEFSKTIAANRKIRAIVSDKWEGKKYFDRTAYKINGDGEKMFVDKTGVSVARGTLLVGVKGKRKGEILYGRGFVHAELLHAAHDGEENGTGSLDDYVHFYIKNESPEDGSGNEILSADLSYAGVALNYDFDNEEEWQEQIVKAYGNLYTANEYLVKGGVSKNRDIEIYEPRKFKPSRTKLEIQFSTFFDKLAELGAGFLGLLGIELHGGEVHKNGTTQEIHGGVNGGVNERNFNTIQEEYYKKLHPKVQQALDIYAIDSSEINKNLRKGKKVSSVNINDLDEAFIYTIKKDTTVFKGSDKPIEIGGDKGYTSVSLSEVVASTYGDYVTSIIIPSGTKVAIPNNEHGDYEIILPREWRLAK